MSEFWPNISTNYFDGNSSLDVLLNPPKPISRFISPVGNIASKPIDDTDVKLIGYLTGKKVCFSDEELKEYIIEEQFLEDKQPAKDDS